MGFESKSVPIPQLKQIQCCPNCWKQLVIIGSGKCLQCGKEINYNENESKNIS
jgi:predicted amidophosphoribosyltransferase